VEGITMNNIKILEFKEGIYYIRKVKDGTHLRLMGDKIADLNDICLRSGIEPYRKDFTLALKKYLEKHRIEKGVNIFKNLRVKDMVKLIMNEVKEK
jgi:hypothetical protein